MGLSRAVRGTFCFVVGIFTILLFAGRARAQAGERAEAACGAMYGAKICASYRTRAGKVSEFSLHVPVAMIEKVPADLPMVWPPKPDLVVRFAPVVERQTGFRFANVYWNPHGHPPAAYMVPHFDFHFYFVPQQKVDAIDCKDTRKPRTAPPGYTLPDVSVPHLGDLIGLCVPAMGMHAIPDGDLNPKSPWKGSILAGYYAGEPMFIEPMITRALLLRKQSFSLPIPQMAPPARVRLPRRFRAVYLPKSRSYDLTFYY